MAGIPESFIEQVKDRNDILEVVSDYVQLRRRGSNHVGLCPFHNENTGSFSVNQEKQIYKCFGCGKGGGVFSFIQEIEHLTFPESVEFLAKRVNLPMPEQEISPESSKRKRLFALNKDAATFYCNYLFSDAGKPGQAYVLQRGISIEMVKRFGLGFAPDSWTALTDAMVQKGYSQEELLAAGLAKQSQRNNSIYDAFRNRLMFPVIDLRKNVLGFSGRILSGDGPKYVNSPDTLVYTKGQNIFAINLAKDSKADYFLLTEGNIDVVSLHQAGFDSAVASLGTAFTKEQAKLLSTKKNQVVLCYDSDTAGQAAAQKAIKILAPLDVKVRVLQMEGAKDPDEYIQKFGAEKFRKLIEGSEGQVSYRLSLIEKDADLSTVEGKADYLKKAIALVAGLPDKTQRELYAGVIAEKASISKKAAVDEIEAKHKAYQKRETKQEATQYSHPEKTSQPSQKEFRYDNVHSAQAEEGLIALLFNDPELGLNEKLPAAEKFSSPELQKFYQELLQRIQENEPISISVLESKFTPEEMSLFIKVTEKALDLSKAKEALRDYVRIIEKSNEDLNDLTKLIENKKHNDTYGGTLS